MKLEDRRRDMRRDPVRSADYDKNMSNIKYFTIPIILIIVIFLLMR